MPKDAIKANFIVDWDKMSDTFFTPVRPDYDLYTLLCCSQSSPGFTDNYNCFVWRGGAWTDPMPDSS